MPVKFRSLLQQVEHHLVTILIIVIILVVAIVLIIVEVSVYGTGFPGKTLWDWLQLLIIPIVLAGGGFLFNLAMSRNQQEVTSDNQLEAALQEYINKMSELLLKEHLGELLSDGILKPENERAQEIARIRTLTVLPRLDGIRKRSVLLFLHEAGLLGSGPAPIYSPRPLIINLFDADFRQADLSRAHLIGVSLSKANLTGADLSETYLRRANLHRAVLTGANLSNDNPSDDNPSAHYTDEKPNLREAKLDEAVLSNANLHKADLIGANLSSASLQGANLSETDLRGAQMGGTVLTEAKLLGTKYKTKPIPTKDENGQPVFEQQGKPVMIEPTQWPQGFDCSDEKWGLICDNSQAIRVFR